MLIGALAALALGCGRVGYDPVQDGGDRLDASLDGRVAFLDGALFDAGCDGDRVTLVDGRCVPALTLEVRVAPGARSALFTSTTSGDAEVGVVLSTTDLGAVDADAVRTMRAAAGGASVGSVPLALRAPTEHDTTYFAYVVAYRPLAGGATESVLWTGSFAAEPLVLVRSFMHAGLPTEAAVFVPDAYFADPATPRPTILFLHGWGGATAVPDAAGLMMNDGLLERIVSTPGLYRDFPFIVVAPHCIQTVHGGCWGWTNHTLAMAALDDAASGFAVDPARTYVTGLSTGGQGTFTVASAYPARFAAAVPIASTYDAATRVCDMTGVPIWAFHGDADSLQPPSNSQSYVDRIARSCPSAPAEAPTLTLLPCRDPPQDHCGWIEAYDGSHGAVVGGFASVFDWMLSHTR